MEKLAEDYAKLIQSIRLDKEVNSICLNIEDLLARLDELEHLLGNVKAENNIITEYVQSILNKANQFQILQQNIDKLEIFIEMINKNVIAVENAVDTAENELNVNDYGLKSLLLKSFIGKSRSTIDTGLLSKSQNNSNSSNLNNDQYQTVAIFNTTDYFDNNETVI